MEAGKQFEHFWKLSLEWVHIFQHCPGEEKSRNIIPFLYLWEKNPTPYTSVSAELIFTPIWKKSRQTKEKSSKSTSQQKHLTCCLRSVRYRTIFTTMWPKSFGCKMSTIIYQKRSMLLKLEWEIWLH